MSDEGAPVDLVAELTTARKRVDELARAYQALERDREDFKQRLLRERERALDVERGEVALALLEAIDDLDLALAEAEDTPFAQGVAVVRDNLLKKAGAMGIERVALLGQAYDPTLAEAADLEITPEQHKDNVITAELRAGYRLKDRVVRPARVKVARYVKPAEA
ncbi:MAG: nucleotide exchange factor GrpE [Myxococcaceae bacterium]|nr:nucleotide exchange factor GrpE [Myxococcaceae bacterium]